MDEFSHFMKLEDFLRVQRGEYLSASKHVNPAFDALERTSREIHPPLHPDLRTTLRILRATETLGINNYGDPRDYQNKGANPRYFHHDASPTSNDFSDDIDLERANVTDFLKAPIDIEEDFAAYYDEQVGRYIPINQVRVRHVRTVAPETGSYPAASEVAPPAVFPFAFLRIDYNNASFGQVKMLHSLMGVGYEDGVLYNISASHENYIPVGTELVAYHVKGRWYVDYRQQESADSRVKVVRILDDGFYGLAYPNASCVLAGKTLATSGLSSDMCGDDWDIANDIWVFMHRPNSMLPLISHGNDVVLAYRALDAFDVGGDSRPLYVLHDPQVDPPIVGIFDPDYEGDDAEFLDRGASGRIALIQAAGPNAPFVLSIPEEPIYIEASNQILPRIWRGSMVFIQPVRMNPSVDVNGKYELQIIAAYSAKVLRGTAVADFNITDTEIAVENLQSFDGHHPLSGAIGSITDVKNRNFWGGVGDNVRIFWNDTTSQWELMGVEPPRFLIYYGTLNGEHTNPDAQIAVTPLFAVGTGYDVTTFGSVLAQNNIGGVGDSGDYIYVLYDFETALHHALNIKHKIFEPLVGIEIDVATQKVVGHRKKISVMTWTQTGENKVDLEDTYECP